MEITRETEIQIETKRRFTIRRAALNEPIFCIECGGATLTAEHAANLFQINQRLIFQLIERGAAHFAEVETGAVLICLPALAAVLQTNNENQQIQAGANQL